jgi:hypothetical protein
VVILGVWSVEMLGRVQCGVVALMKWKCSVGAREWNHLYVYTGFSATRIVAS